MSLYRTPEPRNEPVLSYAPGSPEATRLAARLRSMQSEEAEIPMVIDGKDVSTGDLKEIRPPHDHRRVVARYHAGQSNHVEDAIAAARKAQPAWRALPFEQRISVFLKAADLLATTWRDHLNAATMIGQSKSVHQAEIDAACELIDFFRFNAKFAEEIYRDQPASSPGMWNRMEQRPLEGFVYAVTPFNFTSIAGNLPTAPAMMGNTVVWKPASTSVLSSYWVMRLLQEAGLPDGVINVVYGSGSAIGSIPLQSPDFAGVHFTGSTAVFQGMWREIGSNIERYRAYPRIVGETGGKDFIFAHSSADPQALAVAMVRGAFEYQGQKCSAASRAYVPKSMWPDVLERVRAMLSEIRMGPVEDFSNFMNAVIDRSSFEKLKGAIDEAKASSHSRIVAGGEYDDSEGYFIKPTVIETSDATYRTMCEELFGPIITVYPYEDAQFEATLDLCDSTSPYALTGAVFAQDRYAVDTATRRLVDAAGNFYINDKPTGAVVGQQPFGGGRASGTNDKAGSKINLLRWLNPRTIKETFVPPHDYRYPFLGEVE